MMGAALILFLLGFGALAVGVLIGRYYVPDDRVTRRTAQHARAYMRAINHLLARDRDAAIDELKQVVSESVDEIEPYFALGALFRSRGECERAIRVHQAIELRDGSGKKIRLRARYELGLDFRAAGMPRRATRAMEDVIGLDTKHEGALRALCGLYEEQGRYAEAAVAWKRLHKLRGEHRYSREHHLLVAAAQRAIAGDDSDSAKRLLRDAEKHREGGAHAAAAAAELAAMRGNFKGATVRLKQALQAAPDLTPFFLNGLVEAERQQVVVEIAKEQKKAEAPLAEQARMELEDQRTFERAAVILDELAEGEDTGGKAAKGSGARSPHLLLAAADMRSHFDPAAALVDYRDIAEEFPDLLPARVAAGRLALAADDPDEIARELIALVGENGALDWVAASVWRCGNCGHSADDFFWRCVQCRRWGSVRLDVGRAALEAPPPPPRERREVSRIPSDSLLGAVAAQALPEPSLESGLSDDELAEAGQRPSLLGRVGSIISSPFRKKGDGSPPQLKE